MKRFGVLIFGIVSYAIFFGTFLYAVGFLSNLVVPKSIDSGEAGSTLVALAVNIGLLGIFGLQHSVMARIGFKNWWTRFVPRPIERSVYVLASSIAMGLIFWLWQPMPEPVFQVAGASARAAILGMFFGGVGLVLYSTFLIDHFDLFGLRQVVLHFRGREYTDKRFKTPQLYRFVRHPLYIGWFITFWATPDLTVGHLLMAGVTTGYMLVAIVFEERDMSTLLGDEYRQWRSRTPMFLPRFSDRPRSEGAAVSDVTIHGQSVQGELS